MTIQTGGAHVWDELRADLAQVRQVPTATYRVQFNRRFTFDDARRLVPYWKALGISHVYASPYFRARPESMHGYDIIDHNSLNPSIGSREAYDRMVDELHRHQMGQIVDMVPNHMGIGEPGNQWWTDVLENGPSSPYAGFFDIDWNPLKNEMANQVLLPILGAQYGLVLENQELRLHYENGAFELRYWETRLPVAPITYIPILEPALEQLQAEASTSLPGRPGLAADDPDLVELQSIITSLTYLPSRTESDPDRIAERQREKEVVKRRLNALAEANGHVRAAIEQAVTSFNGTPGEPASFDRLDQLVRDQAYRLAYWRVAAEEINYRRFFDINELAAIRMERPEVFEATHGLLLELVSNGAVNGLRVDHPDGLWDPAGYFRNLQRYTVLALARRRLEDDENWEEVRDELLERYDEAWHEDPHSLLARPLYVVVEKILGHGEPLPRAWTVDGTSGYEFLNLVNGLWVDGANARVFDQIYSAFTKQRWKYNDLVMAKKRQVMLVSLVSELNVLAHQLDRISERNRYVRDFTLNSLTFALREVIACFPVYRTYITGDELPAGEAAYIEEAVRCARRRSAVTDPSVFDFIRDVLLLRAPHNADEEYRQAQSDWVQRFQQLTGPVMAKGLEDTTFYLYNRLVSLNEVGGEPQRFGSGVREFHRANAERLRNWPHTMLATSTHDTKRSEDVRARIDVLSEMPREWRQMLTRWSRANRRHLSRVEGRNAPDRNEQYLFYQAVLGTWPFEAMNAQEHEVYVARIRDYLLKAIKEAKENASWILPNEPWESAVANFVTKALENRPGNPFLADLRPFAERIARLGAINSLSQTTLKLTAPGMPDVYQGNELWDFSLVDPDNRRPVDYERRRDALRRLNEPHDNMASFVRELLEQLGSGEIKMWVTTRTLQLRTTYPQLFAAGAYTALEAEGERTEHVVAFARSDDENEVIVVVPRLVYRLMGDAAMPLGEIWGDDVLQLPASAAGARYTNWLNGAELRASERDGGGGLRLADVFADAPVAVLVREALTPGPRAPRAKARG